MLRRKRYSKLTVTQAARTRRLPTRGEAAANQRLKLTGAAFPGFPSLTPFAVGPGSLSLSFGRGGRSGVTNMSDQTRLAADVFPPKMSGALVVDDTPLPVSTTSLPAPVQLVELSPSHLVLQSRWFAPFLTLGAGFALFLLVLAIVCTVFVVDIFADPIRRQVALRVGLGWTILQFAALGAIGFVALPLLCWTMIKRHRGHGPFHFDRDADRLLFGRASAQQARPLSTIAALQLIPTTSLTVSGNYWAALGESWLTSLLRWGAAREKIYQLNLVFVDGSRLNLTNWGNWSKPHSIQVLTQQLAEFLSVPLKGPRMDEQDTPADVGRDAGS